MTGDFSGAGASASMTRLPETVLCHGFWESNRKAERLARQDENIHSANSGILDEADMGVATFHLARPSFASELSDNLGDHRATGCSDWMPTGEKAPVGVHGDIAVDFGSPVPYGLCSLANRNETETLD